MTESEVRLFSVERANSALPLVRRIVADITAEHPQWQDLVSQYELIAAGARPEWGESGEMVKLRRQVDALAARIASYFAELGQVGCELKDMEQGLVDFHALYEGRLVCLCWQRGEEAITHWHERNAGFAGRQPITPEFSASLATPVPARTRQ